MPTMYDCHKVSERGFWPEAAPVDNTDIGLARPDGAPFEFIDELGEEWTRRAWRLDLDRDGTLSLRVRGEKPFNGAAIPVYYSDSREDLVAAQRMLGVYKAQWPDKRLTHEGGERFMWCGWLPGTTWQLSACARVVHLFVTERHGDAVREANRLSKLVEDAAARDGFHLNAPAGAR